MGGIRAARPDDAPAIAGLILTTGLHDTADAARIASLIRMPGRTTHALEVDGSVRGFVDGFPTIGADNTLRWEVDLLAVHPDFQGRGLARRLVEASTAAGVQRGAALARGLVRADNRPARRTFEGAGYVREDGTYELRVSRCQQTFRQAVPGEPTPRVHVVRVSTLIYDGLWLEGALTAHDFLLANNLIGGAGDIAGAVIAAADTVALAAARGAGYSRAGRYHWLVRTLTADAG